ncbi:MAG: transporter substrate-binding domain-containing protein [Hyphomicrobiales bacterium]|nr:transporter substrate-binding domain-containing protein [Hyphomicrobiales bacterium]
MPNAQADVLGVIRAKGEIVIGVRDDDPPFGFRNDDGELQGLEIDLARDLAARAGATFTPFAINSTSRLQFIELGLHDALIGMLAVTERRKQQARLVEPYYYATTVAVLASPQSGASDISGLSGKRVCMLSAAIYAEAVAAHPANLDMMPVRTLEEAHVRLGNGDCDGIAAEIATLAELKKKHPNLGDHALMAIDAPPLPWAIAINHKNAGSDFERLISDAVTDWHRSGKLKSLEKKWLGVNTDWVLRRHEAQP